MSIRADKKQQTRQRLISEALKLSSTKGFATLSLREVSTSAGITPAAFYNHFDDMEELGLSLLDEVALSLRRLLRNARKNSKDRNSGITKSSIDTFLKYITDNPNHFRLLLGERQGASQSFRKAVHNAIDNFVSELTEDLERIAKIKKAKLRNSSLSAEAIVAIVFTVGAEGLELPKHKQAGLANRLVEEVNMVMRGSYSV
jgi:TetR/AcrR family transcriptional regulator, fatty acid biosynthesis regulator